MIQFFRLNRLQITQKCGVPIISDVVNNPRFLALILTFKSLERLVLRGRDMAYLGRRILQIFKVRSKN